MRQGTWWIRSRTDPRWDAGGQGLVGGFTLPEAARKLIEELRGRLGEPPDDLEFGYMKD